MKPSSAIARGTFCGLAAAALFGASAPIAKVLLPASSPLVLAGLLYAGAGAALTIVRLARKSVHAEAKLQRRDLPLLAAIALTGGVFGPVLC